MGSLFKEGSIFSYISTNSGASTLAIGFIVLSALLILAKMLNLRLLELIAKMFNLLLNLCGKAIFNKETKYNRDLAIGKLNEKSRRVKIYRFLNDLIIDLELKSRGMTPYGFLFVCIVITLFITVIMCKVLFNNLWMVLFMFPIVFAGFMSVLYTKANIAHDARIEAVIEAENILCNNIKDGVVVAVRDSIDVIPERLRGVFKDFLDNVEHKNYHIRTALLELNQHLGSISDDFIKKCIILETEEEPGIVGMFKDIVEINNIKMEMRTEMKRKFEEVVMQFIIGALMIFIFLGGVIGIYPHIAQFYLRTPIGQIIIGIDALIVIGEFVYITYLRAKEL